jgi:hypothetical protein
VSALEFIGCLQIAYSMLPFLQFKRQSLHSDVKEEMLMGAVMHWRDAAVTVSISVL